jgi:hypothetical protein
MTDGGVLCHHDEKRRSGGVPSAKISQADEEFLSRSGLYVLLPGSQTPVLRKGSAKFTGKVFFVPSSGFPTPTFRRPQGGGYFEL